MLNHRKKSLRRWIYGALAVAVAATGLMVAREAMADPTRVAVKATSFRAPASSAAMLHVKLASVKVAVSAGQSAYLNSNLRFSNASTRILVDNQLECVNNKGVSVRKVLRSQNVFAKGNGSLSAVSLTSRFLLPSKVTANFRCDVSVWTRSLGAAGRVSLTSGFVEVAGKYRNTATAATSTRALVSAGKTVWTPSVKGTASVPKHSGLWAAPSGAKRLSVFGDFQLTTCYGKDKAPCPVTSVNGKGSLVRTTLVATQFKKDGSVCKSSSYTQDTRIPQYVHHKPIYLNNSKVPVVTGGGCVPIFSVYAKHTLRADHPYYIHGRSDDGIINVFAV
ncbi:MAG TPA: hypothetical protein VE172_04620 [Stackebrandtia sp.]|jgi:hypothetical protein|uniref:hypothetical protein n=1 Tax=Stackebrandtia sp. TaxID=2023065 RepID=UPI002D69A257|nr:hypothetical protein [Stackebrandtia sp.]HZE38077.1 hypothetical protein [Stackebrandtia sp.]